MARRKNSNHNGPGLFDEQERQLERRIRRQRALFIPRFLREAALNLHLRNEAQDKAHEIAIRWADLETKGHLPQYKETSIDTQFLDQLFGEGLGYHVKTASPDAWQLEHKFSVSGVGIADAALGDFPRSHEPTVVVELKGALTDLDRDRSNGRTAVQQCWDYLNALPGCTWGIVSNFKTIRLYHHPKGTLSYEEFSLQELRNRERFNEFYCLFERGGLLQSAIGQAPRALELLRRTTDRQNEVGEDLYKSYHMQRLRLIEHLKLKMGKPLDSAIRIAQKLLDRIIFIAFCEDRDLLNKHCLKRASEKVAAFSQARNPLWQNFLGLFAEVDRGGNNVGVAKGYNGNLFKPDPEIDDLQLEDEPWVRGFKNFGDYDFSEEVNVEVLGHLFERSITELEKLRVGGLFALKARDEDLSPAEQGEQAPAESRSPLSKMPKSAQRKRFGIYYTPAAFTGLVVERTVDTIVRDRFGALQTKYKVDPESRAKQNGKRLLDYWQACLEDLQRITVCDPACGSGAFLIRAYDALDVHYKGVVHALAGAGLPDDKVALLEDAIPDLILNQNLYGVDLSQEAVEITQLALWIRSARRGKTLADLSKHIICGNSLVSDARVDARALDWRTAFPSVFGKDGAGGFTCVIGNPPWERVKVQDREFFSLTDPKTAGAVSANDRKRRIAAMPAANPELHDSYLAARDHAQRLLDYARGSGQFPLTGKGDVNLYMLFAELASNLVAPEGLVGLLVPSGIATDDTTKDFFASLMDGKRLASLYDFENREKIFADVDGRFKFSALVFGGEARETQQADFVFFAHSVDDTAEVNKQRHIPLTAADMALLNPNTKTCPIFRTRRDAVLTKSIYKRIPILIDENRKQGGNPWGIRFFTMYHQTNDAEHFHAAKVWEKKGYKLDGNVYKKPKKRALPLYEAKMVQAFDHRAASVLVDEDNWVRQGQKAETSLVQHQNPEFAALPRWWVDEAAVNAATEGSKRNWLLSYKDVTSATNERTMIASFLPWVAVVNSAPIIFPGTGIEPRRECCLLANLNAFVLDYVARQKVGSVHLNFFIVEQLPTLPPDEYANKCPWSKRETLERWISERVLKLSCTADDMKPLAEACDFRGSQGNGVHKWRVDERIELRAELDAAFAHLYGVSEDDFAYMLSTFPAVHEDAISATLDAYRRLASKS
ncbi:MAG TPA: DNA methyltransferase [Pirellulales bacterium]|nr:DNA methyltransferase [Pirellulales bacterium]